MVVRSDSRSSDESSDMQNGKHSQAPQSLPDGEKHKRTSNGSLFLSDSHGDESEKDAQLSTDIEHGAAITKATESPIKRVVTAQDWTGPDDPENPFNWPLWRRYYNTACTALFAFTVTFASSVYTPGYKEIAVEFGVSDTASLLGLSLYVLGLGAGPLIAAPISETFGRSIVYRITIPMALLFTLGAGFSRTFTQLLVCRFFAAVLGSPVLAVGSGTNVDLWPTQTRAVATSLFLMAPFGGPALGPFVGGYSVMKRGWRWTEWDILFVGAAFYAFSLGISETYKKVILQRRAKRLGIEPPKGQLSGKAMFKTLFTVTLLRPLHMLATEPIVAFLSIYSAFTFAVLFAFFAAFPIVFVGVYDFNIGESGLTFLAVGLGVLLSVLTGVAADRMIYRKKHAQVIKQGGHVVAPEHRLYTAMFGSVGLPIGLFIFAWSARGDIHWIVPVLASIPFAWGNLSIFLSTALYLADTYGPMNGASAMAANGLLRYTMGAIFPLFTVQMYHHLGIGWATSVFGFVSLALMPIPWVLYKWGPRIRSKSSYDTIKA